jgi:hypothetical protein
MATPIKDTPILRGKDAKRFMEAANNPKKVSKEELERIRKSAAKFKRINF